MYIYIHRILIHSVSCTIFPSRILISINTYAQQRPSYNVEWSTFLFLTTQEKTEPTVIPCLQHWYEDWHTIVLLPKWPPHNFLYIWNVHCVPKMQDNFWCLVFFWMCVCMPCYLLPLACLNNLLHDYVVLHKYLIIHKLLDE